jgi:hypothetical protein
MDDSFILRIEIFPEDRVPFGAGQDHNVAHHLEGILKPLLVSARSTSLPPRLGSLVSMPFPSVGFARFARVLRGPYRIFDAETARAMVEKMLTLATKAKCMLVMILTNGCVMRPAPDTLLNPVLQAIGLYRLNTALM